MPARYKRATSLSCTAPRYDWPKGTVSAVTRPYRRSDTSTRHPRYVGRVERGDNNVAILTLARLAAALDLTIAKLMQRAGL